MKCQRNGCGHPLEKHPARRVLLEGGGRQYQPGPCSVLVTRHGVQSECDCPEYLPPAMVTESAEEWNGPEGYAAWRRRMGIPT